eukprot:12903308-Prorocentrum_lima.AAC.1
MDQRPNRNNTLPCSNTLTLLTLPLTSTPQRKEGSKGKETTPVPSCIVINLSSRTLIAAQLPGHCKS